jgi:hypothetical protein
MSRGPNWKNPNPWGGQTAHELGWFGRRTVVFKTQKWEDRPASQYKTKTRSALRSKDHCPRERIMKVGCRGKRKCVHTGQVSWMLLTRQNKDADAFIVPSPQCRYEYTRVYVHYMFQPKWPSLGTWVFTIPLLLYAIPPYTGQCLHLGSVLLFAMPLYYILKTLVLKLMF